MTLKKSLNRRNFDRVHTFVSATIHTDDNSPDDNEALILNLSTGGAMLLSTTESNTGDKFSLSLIVPDERIIFVRSEIRWKCGDMIGISFLDLSAGDTKIIEEVVNRGEEDLDEIEPNQLRDF